MKTALSMAVALMFLTSTASAQAGSVGVFADPMGLTCNLSDTPPVGVKTYYVVHVNTTGATAVQYQAKLPLCMRQTGALWLSDTNMFPVVAGNSQTGVSITYDQCRGGPIFLQIINVFGMGMTPQCCQWDVTADPNVPSGMIEASDCSFEVFYPTGLSGIINPNPACYCSAPEEPNSPPVALCQNVTVTADEGCTANASIDDGSYDPDGDPITLTQTPPGPYPVGMTTVTLTVTDDKGASDTCTGEVTVISGPPGDVTVTLNRDVLWPPNHKMADVYATVTAANGCCPTPPTYTLVSVTSDEPENGLGDGNTYPDIVIIDDTHVQLRSERSGKGDGRVYTITYLATDCSGNTASTAVTVRVPHDHAGWALASMGFTAGGIGFDPALERFVLVIPSRAAEYGFDANGNRILISEAFDATALDPARTYVGNVKGVTLPNETLTIDNNADGLMDLALYYSAQAVNDIIEESAVENDTMVGLDGSYGAIGVHYVSAQGVDYLVPNIFLLGDPVPLVPPIVIRRTAGDTGDMEEETPKATALLSAHPNPFNPSTTIPFELAAQERVRLTIYDARGQVVRSLMDEVLPAGVHSAVWDGRDNSGSQAATGVYFVRFVAGSSQMTKKIVMIK